MRKIITAIFTLLILNTYATAYSIYNTAGDFYDNEPTFWGYIVFDSESEYNSNKVFMEECHIYTTDRELELTQSELSSNPNDCRELGYIIKKNHIKPGAYIVVFSVEEIPGNGEDWRAMINYKYIK